MSDDWWKREATHLKARVTELEAERAKALRFRGERPDGTDRLALALYGRTAEPRDYLGGSQAAMLHEAAVEIERLRRTMASAHESHRLLTEERYPGAMRDVVRGAFVGVEWGPVSVATEARVEGTTEALERLDALIEGLRTERDAALEEMSTLRELLGLVLRQATMPDALRSRIVACVAGAPEVVALDAERD